MPGEARDSVVFLVRHAAPAVQADVPPAQWPLSEEGLEATRRLAGRLVGAEIDVDLVVSSVEPKARQTADVLSDRLRRQFQTGHDLHEHRRPWVGGEAEFEGRVRELFASPSKRVFGEGSETATEAGDRFDRAVAALHKAHRGRRLMIVTHGTVLALHLGRHYGVDAWTTWNRLTMPSYVALDRKTKTILDVVTDV